jgi:hypothetical protein
MERTIQIIMVGLILVFSLRFAAIVDAAYLIKLRNGNEFVTGRYWQEGQQLMFDIHGGVFGVDRAFVSKIEKSEKPTTLTEATQTVPEQKPQADITNRNDTIKPSTSVDAKPEVKRDDDPIMKDLYSLKEKFKGLDGMLTPELQQFSRDLSDFKRKIQLSGKSNDYLREFGEAHEMGDALEEALKSRR